MACSTSGLDQFAQFVEVLRARIPDHEIAQTVVAPTARVDDSTLCTAVVRRAEGSAKCRKDQEE
jgi:hypothetical protein